MRPLHLGDMEGEEVLLQFVLGRGVLTGVSQEFLTSLKGQLSLSKKPPGQLTPPPQHWFPCHSLQGSCPGCQDYGLSVGYAHGPDAPGQTHCPWQCGVKPAWSHGRG